MKVGEKFLDFSDFGKKVNMTDQIADRNID